MQVVVPGPPDEKDLEGVMAISQVYLREGHGLKHAEIWAMIRAGELLIFPSQRNIPPSTIDLNHHTLYSELFCSPKTNELLHLVQASIFLLCGVLRHSI